MRRAGVFAAVLVTLGVAAAAAQTPTPAKAAAVAGKWTLTLETEAFTATSTLELKQDVEKVTGTYNSQRYGPSPLQGAVKERAIQFSVKLNADGTDVVMAFTGEVAADGLTMKGRASIGDMGDATWSAKKDK